MIQAKEIIEEIKKRPPLQRKETAIKYRGIKVLWEVEFCSVLTEFRKNINEAYIITAIRDGYNWTQVCFEIDIKKYPELNILKEGRKFWVDGKILSIDAISFSIELEGCVLKFKSEALEEKSPIINNNLDNILTKSDQERELAEKKEIVKLEPNFYGVGINLKPLWLKIKNYYRKKNKDINGFVGVKWYRNPQTIIAAALLIIAFISILWWPQLLQHFSKQKSQNLVPGQNLVSLEEQKLVLQGSIYDLIRKIESKETTLDKQELVKKYVGLKVNDKGYIMDLMKSNISGNVYYYANIAEIDYKSNPGTYPGSVVWFSCIFGEDWGRLLETLTIPSKISVEGYMEGDGTLQLHLSDCKVID